MRIITGLKRGKRLETPEGLDTRPTTDRLKQSIFNIIQFDIEGRNALDLFAGSGQLGLEAVSRGAAGCTFVDSDRVAQDIIEKNIKSCDFGEKCQLVRGDFGSFLARQKSGAFGLIFLDPPYGGELLRGALHKIISLDLLTQGGIIICELSVDDVLPAITAPYSILREYNYGGKKLVTITRGEI